LQKSPRFIPMSNLQTSTTLLELYAKSHHYIRSPTQIFTHFHGQILTHSSKTLKTMQNLHMNHHNTTRLIPIPRIQLGIWYIQHIKNQPTKDRLSLDMCRETWTIKTSQYTKTHYHFITSKIWVQHNWENKLTFPIVK